MQLSPSAVSRELKKKIGDVQQARILRDRNLLIAGKREEEKNNNAY